MTATARTVLPTDLVALVSYDGRVYANEAMTRDRIGTHASPHPLGTAFEQWFTFATGRHTWISVKGTSLRGLVSARRRGSKLAWEVDCLLHAHESDDAVVLSLLDNMTEAAGKAGALKIFLRVRSDSPVERLIENSGFIPYVKERAYCRKVDQGASFSTPEGLRRRAKSDRYPLFQLYNQVVPKEARRYEAMTMAEWNAVQESLGRTSQYVLERDGRANGWLRVARDGDIGRFDLLATADIEAELLDAAMSKVARRETACTIVPEYQESLQRRLEDLGFEAGEEYTLMARRTVRPVKQSKVVPALVQTTLA